LSVPGTSPFASIADELGIAHQTLRNWVQQADVDAGNRDGLRTEERQELRRFQREVKRLRMERDILKKAAGLLRQRERGSVETFRFIDAG
jgi:transposase